MIRLSAAPSCSSQPLRLRSAALEIDELALELRNGERVAIPQPRVFALIVYLARNRERVVLKDELLDALWPNVVVTDASLQRAVSLARSAFAELGVSATIRTYARQGYRFVEKEPAAIEGVGAAG